MKEAKLLRQLRRLQCAINASCTYVNYGGCAVMAAIAAERLQALGIEVECITPYYHAPASCRALIPAGCGATEWMYYGVGFGHVAIRFLYHGCVYTWDSDRMYRCSKRYGHHHRCYYPFGAGLTPEECWDCAKEEDGWNEAFDRDQIPLLRALAAQYLR